MGEPVAPRPGDGVATDSPVVLATRSEGKLRELRPLFEAAGWQGDSVADAGIPESRAEDELETASTFAGNALAKARWFAARLPGRLVVADDSGLEVDALGGAPGVLSKRWSGRPDLEGEGLDAYNNELLGRRLVAAGALDDSSRGARYVCAAAAVWPGGELVRQGGCEGRILLEPMGAGGFGYDPWFWSTELGRGFGEASRDEKASVSHRGRAFRALIEALGGAPTETDGPDQHETRDWPPGPVDRRACPD